MGIFNISDNSPEMLLLKKSHNERKAISLLREILLQHIRIQIIKIVC